jgi:hypothetical protein
LITDEEKSMLNVAEKWIHPSLGRRVGEVSEALLLLGTVVSIWASVVWTLVGSLFQSLTPHG